jgi:signal transduction histidine kinase
MNIRIYLTWAFMLGSLFCLGQTKIDYYQHVINTTSNPQLKLQSTDSLIFIHKRAHNIEASANYVEKYVDLALQQKEYAKATEMVMSLFYQINIVLGQPDRALALIEKVESYVDQLEDSYLKGGIYLKKGGGYFNGKNYEKAIEHYSKAIELYSDKDSIYKADAIFFRGQANSEIGNFIAAINDYQLASRYYENLGDQDYVFYTLGSAISVYSIMGFIEKAVEERERYMAKKLALNYDKGWVTDYYNQSISYKKLGNKEKQLECLLASLKGSKKTQNESRISAVYSALSRYYTETDLKTAKEFLDASQKALETNSKTAFDRQQHEVAKAYYLAQSGNPKKAIRLYKKVLAEAVSSHKSSLILEIQKQLSDLYSSTKDYRKAFEYHQKYTQLKDSLFSRTKTNALAYYQTLYETEKKESEILQQQSAIEVLDAENKNKNRLIIFGGIGLVLIFLIVLLYRNRKSLQKQHQLQANYAQNLLRSQDVERQRISKDLHDSLGQSLLLVKQKIHSENKEAKELLNNAIDEMRSISRTLYPLQLKELGITSAIHSLIEQLDENYPDTYIFGDVDNIDGLLTTENELNLFRIIQECLSNVIKHAKAQSARLELQKKDHKIVVTLQDNGIGFDFLAKFKNLKSLGLKTIKERVRYINGILRVESSPGNGSKFNIEIRTS